MNFTTDRLSGRMHWLLFALSSAFTAAALRRWQLLSAFEEDTGLPMPGAQASVVLTCVLVMAAAWFAILAVGQPLSKRPEAPGQAQRWDLVFLAVGFSIPFSTFAVSSRYILWGKSVFQEDFHNVPGGAGIQLRQDRHLPFPVFRLSEGCDDLFFRHVHPAPPPVLSSLAIADVRAIPSSFQSLVLSPLRSMFRQ